MGGFCHLHAHSAYSLLDGAQSVPAMAARAAAMGQGALALTDHGWMAGAVSLVRECRKAGVKPIVGMEPYVVTSGTMQDPAKHRGDNFHLTLLAATPEGYRNMIRVASEGFLQGLHWVPRVDRGLLEANSEGICLLTGCIGAELPQLLIHGREREAIELLRWYAQIYGDRVWVELMQHGQTDGVDHVAIRDDDGGIIMTESQLNEALVYMANKQGLGLVATNDAHYEKQEDGCAHDTLICLGTGSFKEEPDRFCFPAFEEGPEAWQFFLKSEEEMRACRPEDWWQEAVSNTQLVADSISDNVMEIGRTILPPYQIPEDDLGYRVWRETGALI